MFASHMRVSMKNFARKVYTAKMLMQGQAKAMHTHVFWP